MSRRLQSIFQGCKQYLACVSAARWVYVVTNEAAALVQFKSRWLSLPPLNAYPYVCFHFIGEKGLSKGSFPAGRARWKSPDVANSLNIFVCFYIPCGSKVSLRSCFCCRGKWQFPVSQLSKFLSVFQLVMFLHWFLCRMQIEVERCILFIIFCSLVFYSVQSLKRFVKRSVYCLFHQWRLLSCRQCKMVVSL